MTLRDRFWAKVNLTGECWLWTGAVTTQGYGQIWDGAITGRHQVHRLSYQWVKGSIPVGLDLDHLCHNADLSCPGGPQCVHRRCVNPEHLEPATRKRNCERGRTGAYLKARQQCPQGHPYDDSNTLHLPRGRRGCRACMKGISKRYLATEHGKEMKRIAQRRYASTEKGRATQARWKAKAGT